MAESSGRRMRMVESLTDLPPNILLEILARLPLKSLHASRCACKLFLSLTTSNAHFLALHSTSNTAQTLVIQFGRDDKHSRLLCWTDPEHDVVCSSGRNTIRIRLKALFEVPKIGASNMMMYRCSSRYENRYVLVNSCNGLLYFVELYSRHEGSFVCNPVTNEYVTVPDIDRESTPMSETRMKMLGYSVGSNRYKVLRILHTGAFELRGQAHVVGSGSWRDVEDTPLGHDHSWDPFPVYFNGFTFWLSFLEGTVFASSFDFEREKFGLIVLPLEFGKEQLRIKEYISIGILGDCLCVSNNVYNQHLDLWLMKTQGGQESWSKAFVIDTERPIGRRYYSVLRPLQVLGNGEMLMLWAYKDLVCYNPQTKGLRNVTSNWLNNKSHPRMVGFVPSFVPLKDALSVDKVTVQRERPRGGDVMSM